jgi:hypothetical protein
MHFKDGCSHLSATSAVAESCFFLTGVMTGSSSCEAPSVTPLDLSRSGESEILIRSHRRS